MICEFFNENLEYQENLLTKYYVKHGHEVTVATSTFESVFDYYNDKHDRSAAPRIYWFEGAKIVKLRYKFNILNRLRPLRSIAALLDDETPDLIYVHDVSLNFPEAIEYVRRHPRCRMIMDYHADYSNSGKNFVSRRVLHGVVRKWYLDRARPHLSRIFVSVPAGTVFLRDLYGVPPGDTEVLPLGADTDVARAAVTDRDSIRRNLGVPDSAMVVFTGGKLAPAKRTELLIDALAQLRDDRVHLIVAGDSGSNDKQYHKMLVSRAEGLNVTFTGWLDRLEMYRHLAASDLAVFPASQSIVWQQAIAVGLPLIAGDSGHQDISYLNLHRNIVILRGTSISVDGVTSAIRSVLSDPGRIAEMRVGAKRVADEELDWNTLIYRTLRYCSPLERGTAAGSGESRNGVQE